MNLRFLIVPIPQPKHPIEKCWWTVQKWLTQNYISVLMLILFIAVSRELLT